jgi:hypothetical protein
MFASNKTGIMNEVAYYVPVNVAKDLALIEFNANCCMWLILITLYFVFSSID